MGGATGESVNHYVEIPQANRDNWARCISRCLIILAAEVIWTFRIIWGVVETLVGLPRALKDIS